MQGTPSSPHRFRVVSAITVFVILFVVAIPWWWQFAPNIGGKVFLGAPLWFLTSVAGSVLISIVAAFYLSVACNGLDEESVDE